MNKTGGGEIATRALTEIEERLLVLMGTRCVEGDGIDELGDLTMVSNIKLKVNYNNRTNFCY